MYQLGRTMQLAGLVIVPLAVMLELLRDLTLRQSLISSGFGIVLFTLGYFVAGLSKRRS
jgi:hypothetical protein